MTSPYSQPMSQGDLRASLPHAEDHVVGGLVSAFNRASMQNPGTAGQRLWGVCRVFDLADPMTPDGAPTPESRYFHAARQFTSQYPGQPFHPTTALSWMAAGGASQGDLNTIQRHLTQQSDQLTGRPFETYAASLQHLRIARFALDNGARLTPNQNAMAAGQSTDLINQINAAESSTGAEQGANASADRRSRFGRGVGKMAMGALVTMLVAGPAGSAAVGAAAFTAIVLGAVSVASKIRAARSPEVRSARQQQTAARAARAALGQTLDVGQANSPLGGLGHYSPPGQYRQQPGARRQQPGARRP